MTRQRQFLLAAILIALAAGGFVRRLTKPPAITRDPESARGSATSHNARAAPDNAVALIEGFVSDDTGAPIAGARVCANVLSFELPTEMTRDPVCTTSDVRGGYRIIPTLPAEIQLGAMVKDHEPATYAPPTGAFFTMKPGEHRHIDLVARRGGVEVSGIVSDIGGGPITSARVRANGMMVETDDQGRYTLWLSRSWQMVFANAYGYVSQTRTGMPPTHFDFTLEPGATLSGTIVDPSGQPVEGVRVMAASTDMSENRDSFRTDIGFTDDRGRFSIDRLSPGHYVATAYAAHGYGTSEPTLVGIGRVADTTVTLAPAYQIVGHVVMGATRVPCINSYAFLRDAVRGGAVPVVAEADGTLRADGVLPGTYYPAGACGKALAQQKQDPIHIVDHDVEAVWRVAEGATLRGHVRDKHGRPVARAEIRAGQIDAAPRADVGAGLASTTPEGDYVMTVLPGRYRVVASAPGRCCGPDVNTEAIVEVTNAGAERDLVVLDNGARVHGIVTSRGRPLPRVSVRLENSHTTLSLDTDDGGAFELEGVDPSHYAIEVSNRGGALPLVSGPHDIEVAAGASIDLALAVDVKTGAIRGHVVDGGHPVSDAFVTFALEHDDEPGRTSVDRELLVAADGSFVANNLAAGTYSIRARRKGASEVMQRHVALGASVVLELPAAGAIAIAARRDGAPVDDATVSLTRLDDTSQERYEQRIGLHGEIALRDVSPGRYVVSVAANDAHARSEVTVVAGQTASVAFDLEPRVTIVGRVVDARSGRPVPQTAIVVTPESGAMVGAMMTNDYLTDAAGRFEVQHVPRGRLAVTTQLPDDTMQSASTYRTIPHGGHTGEVIDLGDLRVASVPTNRSSVGCVLSIAEVPRAPVVVSAVTIDGPAARAGLVVGDVVTAIDGIDVTGDHGGEASVLLDGSAGATIEVTLQRGVTARIVLDP